MSNHHDHHDGHHHHDDDDAPLEALPPTNEHGYWKTLKELDGKAAFQSADRSLKEFPPGADEAPQSLTSRRDFFQLMGASMALAGVASCRRYEKEEIVPLSRRPEDQTPGITQQYATAFDLGGVGHALLATAFEGRPIHLDGNPEHPWNGGGIVPGTDRHAGASTFAQAAILHLYDPDRSQNPITNGRGASLEAFRSTLPALLKTFGPNARILSEASSSPTLQSLKRALLAKYPGLVWHEYEPLSWDNERAGTKEAFHRPVRPIARLDKCETIVTIDCDLFVEHPASMRYSRDFARSRRLNGTLGLGHMNRLWSIESTFTNTGAMADHRLPLRSEYGLAFALALDAALGGGVSTPAAEFLKEDKVAKYIRVLAEELKLNHGRAVVIAGRRQSKEVHQVVAHLNATIGAVGTTLDYVEDPEPDRISHLDSIIALAKDMAANKVQSLVILGGNPVYDAPADLDFAGALAKVATSVHLHEYQNETSLKATWHLPRAHFLEAWGDARTWDGTITLAQPLIAPMFGGISNLELVAMLLGGNEVGGQKLVSDALAALNIPSSWRQNVHDGFVANTQLPVATLDAPAPPALTANAGSTKRDKNDLEIVFHYSSFTYDGRYANNAWMQETPDFLTKVTWDNYALVGPETALACDLENDTMITVTVGGRSIDLPCYTIPGQARYSIALVLGGGRTAAGRVGGSATRKSVGWDTYKVRQTTGFDIALKGSAKAAGSKYELANIQEHWDIRTGIGNRPEIAHGPDKVNADGITERLGRLIRETTAKELNEKHSWSAEENEDFFNDLALAGNADRPEEGGYSLFKEKDYHGHRWAMAIDLSTCTGCNSCMVACQSENNVPVVGRREVMNNREMSWIRIDRYFSGSPDDPQVVHQPVGCQHCEQAPCEQVCPVGATTHSDEGLNDMAFNRCIGTRYCANNCPYKVRRFNFLDWNKEWREARNKVRQLLFNPDVTVRMRGVMEKCSFCVQRIQNAKIKAKAMSRSGQRPGVPVNHLDDGEIVVACQAACPTEAIVFGDLSNKDSRVSRMHADRRSYALLPETYTKPRNRFLARVRNPNPAMPAAAAAASGAKE